MGRMALALAVVALVACDDGGGTSAGGADVQAAGATGTVTLGIDGAVVFDTGAVDPTGSHLTADLIAYKSGSGLDLKSGVPQGTTSRQPLHLLKTAGGVPATFASLDEVPAELPSDTEANAYAAKVKAGMGLVVRNNISAGNTVVWVEAAEASPPSVTIRYRVIP